MQWINSKNYRDQSQVRLSRILRCWTRELLQEKGQSEGTDGPERGLVSTRKIDRLHDLRLLSSNWRSWYSIGLRWFYLYHFATTVFRNLIRDEMKFHYPRSRSRRMIFWKVCTNWEYVSLINSKLSWNCTTWKFIRRYRCPMIRSWRRWSKKSIDQRLRLRNFWRQERENRNRSSGQESKGLKWRWKRKRFLLSVERKRPGFEGTPVQFPAWEWWSCTKTDTESRSTLWAINDTR